MLVQRIALALAGGFALFAAAPASAQFFFKPADLASERVTGAEPGIVGPALPDASPAELSAALVWNLRAALNVAALQCQFEPTLQTLGNYNAILKDHKSELAASYDTLTKYFTRIAKTKKDGLTELDRYGTRVYSGFSTISGQLSFCQTAADVGHEAVFTRPGGLAELAHARMKELRASLAPWGEQQFRRSWGYLMPQVFPSPIPASVSDDRCWKKDAYVEKKCGPWQGV